MKNNDLTQKQTVQGTKKVIAQNSKQAERILQTAAEETVKVEAKPKKEAKVHAESNEALGERLFKEKADQDRILKELQPHIRLNKE